MLPNQGLNDYTAEIGCPEETGILYTYYTVLLLKINIICPFTLVSNFSWNTVKPYSSITI
jgi:hypothetical protein